jgi:adenylosuccinate synthase
MRLPGAIAQHHTGKFTDFVVVGHAHPAPHEKWLVEVSQGYSLGIDKGFYPYCTSRNCDVAAALSDAGVHPSEYRSSLMVVRCHPIRVAGNSGPCYADQHELTWEELGQTPERTTVTNKVRRVFTWSNLQFEASLKANRPDAIFLNFCNYMSDDMLIQRTRDIKRIYANVLGRPLGCLLMGFGPTSDNVMLYEEWHSGL